MRLDQLMADHQYARKDIKQLLARRQILVDHLPAQKLSQNIDPGLQQIQIGERIIQEPRHHYYMLHKPIGAVTAKRDAHHPTVIDLVDPQQEYPDLYPLGRLDRDTSGLLLVTDNGPLGFQLLHPQYHVEKVYEVEVNGPLYAAHIEQFQNGISFTDGPICKPASLTILESTPQLQQGPGPDLRRKIPPSEKDVFSHRGQSNDLKTLVFWSLHLGSSVSPWRKPAFE